MEEHRLYTYNIPRTCTQSFKFVWVFISVLVRITCSTLYGYNSPKVLTNQSLSLPDISVRMFPKIEYTQASTVSRLVSSVYYVIMYSPFIAVLLTLLVYEKEKKIKETMLMMGT